MGQRFISAGAAVSFFVGTLLPLCAFAEPAEFFRGSVEPILVKRCLECHSEGKKGGLDLRSRESALAGGESGAVIKPGEPDKSMLYRYVRAGEMPPKEALPPEEVEALRQWIADGAWYPEGALDMFAATTDKRAGYDWWSLQPLPKVTPPQSDDASHPIDRFVQTKLAERGLTLSEPAGPRELLRRASYDLIGLPPTPEELSDFIAACKLETGDADVVGERAFRDEIDRLLASPHYGERWARHWMDVVRYGESTGYEVNHLLDTVWPYRDYLIRSFNEDKPFDRLAREQIAADSIAPGDPEVEVALTFLVAGPRDIVGNQDPVQAAQIRANHVDEMVRTTSEAFLGLTVGCARCHDHKFDPISQRDYYRMQATFAGVFHGDREVATAKERAARDAERAPFVEERDRVQAARNAAEHATLLRALTDDRHTKDWTREAASRRGTEETFDPVEAAFVRLTVEGTDLNPSANTGYRIDEFEVFSADDPKHNVALASNGATATGASRSAQDFSEAYAPDLVIDGHYGARWIGSGPKLTIEFARPERIDRVVFSSDRPAAVAETSPEAHFVSDYRIDVSLDGETWIEAANSHDRKPVNEVHRNERLLDIERTPAELALLAEFDKRIRVLNRTINEVPGFPVLHVGTYSQPEAPTRIMLGGDPQRTGDTVRPASLRTLEDAAGDYALPEDAPEKERRAALAEWIVSDDNPLTARVLANRLWHYHFGAGIVSTPSDFGFMGTPPSHPDLLDWLARELTTGPGAWTLKRMHRLIMTSKTYRQSGAFDDKAARIDADARLLWRFPPCRLSGEEIRDTMLQVAGQLDTTMGGPGFRLYSYLRDNVSTYVPLEEVDDKTYRRAVYHQTPRAAHLDFITDYDSPDCAFPEPRRVSTTSPMQALSTMNHDFTMDMAGFLAQRIGGEDMRTRSAVREGFRLALLREPEPEELSAAEALAQEHGLDAFCRALLNLNEFVYVD